MTTPMAERLYQAQHLAEHDGEKYAVYNPHSKPVEKLPFIIGFNNGGSRGWFSAVAIAEDGTGVGEHCCSHECYMRHDLGIFEGARKDRHETDYQKHYPDGYRMDFVPYENFGTHELLQKALALNKAQKELAA